MTPIQRIIHRSHLNSIDLKINIHYWSDIDVMDRLFVTFLKTLQSSLCGVAGYCTAGQALLSVINVIGFVCHWVYCCSQSVYRLVYSRVAAVSEAFSCIPFDSIAGSQGWVDLAKPIIWQTHYCI